jgi:hypothetical protein
MLVDEHMVYDHTGLFSGVGGKAREKQDCRDKSSQGIEILSAIVVMMAWSLSELWKRPDYDPQPGVKIAFLALAYAKA